jgi:hypothetical protein
MHISAQISSNLAIFSGLAAGKIETSPFDLRSDIQAARTAGQIAPAETAAAGKFYPVLFYNGLDGGSIMALQTEPSAEDVFLKEAQKDPLERIVEKLRKEALDAMGESEDSLQSMPAEQRANIEKTISEFIEKKLREAIGGDSQTNPRQTQAEGKQDPILQGASFQGPGSLIEAFA